MYTETEQNVCEFCSETKTTGEAILLEEKQDEYNYANVDIIEGNLLSILLSTSEGNWASTTSNFIEIKYCPMCGRELTNI